MKEKNKIKGVLKGIIKGVTGIIIKPLTGTLDATAKTTEGIKNTITYF